MKKLSILRKLAGLTQQKLARRAGVDRSTLSLAETGQVKLEKSRERRIIKILRGAIRYRSRQLVKMVRDDSQ